MSPLLFTLRRRTPFGYLYSDSLRGIRTELGINPVPAKGASLSVPIRAGTPYSRIAASQIARTWLRPIRETIWQRIQKAAMRVRDGERVTSLSVAVAK